VKDPAIPSEPESLNLVKRRPLSVTVISWLFIATGVIGLVYHLTELSSQNPFSYEVVWVLILRFLAIVSGILMLRGSNWGRWLLLAWMTYHVILSAFHPVFELAMHGLLLIVFAYFLLRQDAAVYFRGSRESAA
jgi:hypothetical protein